MLKRKKLLINSYNLDFGGIEKSLINLLNNLDTNKYEITLLLREKKGAFLKDLNKNIKVKEYKLSSNKIKIFRKSYNRIHLLIYPLIHKYDVSICYATYDIPFALMTPKLAKKSIYYIHSNYTKIYDENNLIKFFNERKINDFDKIVFVSEESKTDLLKYYDIKNKSYVINNLLNEEDIIKKSFQKISLPKGINLVFVGRLEEKSKALLRLFDIIKDMNVNLNIIGDGPDKKVYQKYIKDNKIKNIYLLGSKKNPYPYMKKADLFILPSYYEGFPVVCLEALILKTKVLTTIDVSVNDFYLKDYAFVCDNNEKAIKENIVVALNSKNKKKLNIKKENEKNLNKLIDLIEGE